MFSRMAQSRGFLSPGCLYNTEADHFTADSRNANIGQIGHLWMGTNYNMGLSRLASRTATLKGSHRSE